MTGETTARKLLAALNKHDAKAATALYSPKAAAYDPIFPQPLIGRDAIKKDTEGFFKAFPDLKFKFVNLLSKGNTVAGEALMVGTHKGPIETPTGVIPPTNKRIEVRGALFIRVNAKGQIIEERRYFDSGSFMTQLGLKV